MLRKNLTEEGVAKLKPPKDRQFVNYHDGIVPGLVLRVSSKGRKTWVAQYYAKSVDADGNRTTIPTSKALGLYPILKVKEARDAARVFLADPLKAKAQADTGTFRDVAENFIKRHVEASGLRSRHDIVRLLHTRIYPHWQHRPFREIRRGDVADLLDKIEDNNGARQADVCLAIIRKMMNWYAARNDDYSSPIVRGMHRYNGERKRKRILSDDEIRALWTACDLKDDAGVPLFGTFGALLKTLLLTGQRREKVITMKWADIVDGAWRIPYAPREKTNAGTLRLPPAVLDIVNAQAHLAHNPYVFTGRGSGPFRAFAQKIPLDKKLGDMPHWRLHDLRRTARSLLSRAGVRPDIAERVLGHVQPVIVETYDQHQYDAEKADALNRLAALIATILNPPKGKNVVQLRK
jgi:integrase